MRSAPLYVAAKKGHVDVVRCLGEELGADLNQTNLHENRPLIAAQRYQHEQVVYSL